MPGYGAPGPYASQPSSYLGWSIACIFIGFLFFFSVVGLALGIIATVFSSKVRSRWDTGDQEGAMRASRVAKVLNMIVSIGGGVVLILFIVLIASHGGSTS